MKNQLLKKLFLVICMLSPLVVAAQSPILVENFNYTAGDTLRNIGGAGWTPIATINNINKIPIVSPGLFYNGSSTSGIGNAVLINSTGEDIGRRFTKNYRDSSIYVSFLINVSAAQITGDYFFTFIDSTLSGVNYRARTYIKSSGSGYKIGISKSGAATVAGFYATELAFNTTYQIVIKYTIITGATNDSVKLFVNPILGAAEPITPSAVGSVSETDITINSTTGIGGVALRQGSTASAPILNFDGIIVGRNWADVTKLYNQAPNPVLPNYVPTNGLMGWWPFNGNANDESGNGNTGTLNGTINFVNNRLNNSNNAIEFTTNTDIICTNNLISNPQAFTVSVWFKTQNDGYIIGFNDGKCNFTFNWDRYLHMDSQGKLNFRIYTNSNSNAIITSNNSFKDNQWHNAIFSYSNGSMALYVDANIEAVSNSNIIASNYNGYWKVGGLGTSSTVLVPTILGKLDDIGIWNRALTQQEITSLYISNISNNTANDTISILNTQVDTLVFPNQVKLSIKSSNITSRNISSYDIKINYDANKLKFDSISKINTASTTGSIIVNSITPGQLNIGWASSSNISTSTIPLLNCYFTPIDSGKTTISISNAILNTDTVKNRNSKSLINVFNFGDIDINKIIQSYDASIVLKYSVGIDPIPTIDPLPWELWRIKIASVDTTIAVNANDASLILKYSAGLITKFPKRSAAVSSPGYVTANLENNEIVFRSYEDLGGLNITFLDHLNDLSNPSYIYNTNALSAYNKITNGYKIGIAFSEAPANGTVILKVPYSVLESQPLNMEIVENIATRSYQLNTVTGINEFKNTSIKIYPNPSYNIVNIEGLGVIESNIVEIFDVQGKLIITKTISERGMIDLSGLNNGVYVVKIGELAQRVVKM